MSQGPQAVVDLSSLKANAAILLGSLSVGCRPIWVIKDDAYGLGACRVASALGKGRDSWYAVAYIEEAVALRKHGVEGHILVLQPPAREDASIYWEEDLAATVWGLEDLETLMSGSEKSPDRRLALHVEVDTGMNRGGVAREGLEPLVEEITRRRIFHLDGLYSHLADGRDKAFCSLQRERFHDCVSCLRKRGWVPERLHLGSSAAVLLGEAYHYTMVRPGLALYGAWPFDVPHAPSLRPVLSLVSRLLKVRSVGPGESVGYERAFRTDRDMRLAVVSIGYAHGLSRTYSEQGHALVRGRRVPCLGLTCMDMLLLDVSRVEGAMAEDEVVLLGRQGEDEITIREVSAWMGCSPYEVLCRFGGLCVKRFAES